MPTAVIAGGSVAGLGSALALSRIGYRVVVLERAPNPPRWPPAQAVPWWRRPTVPQGMHSHTLTSLGVRVLRERAPEVLGQAAAAGARTFDLTRALPPGATDSIRHPGDDALVALGIRRSTLELLLHRQVRELPGATIRHDTTVDGIELHPAQARVRGVVTHTGERIPADVVVDATGRRALSRTWLRNAGVPLADDLSSPSGLRAYSRFYRLKQGTYPTPLNRGHAVGDIYDHYAGVLHPGDDNTFSIALGTLPDDRALSGLSTAAGFTAAARATPAIAPWLDEDISTPLSPVQVITSPPNALWGTAGTRQQPVAGLFPVGDAACITNPLFGRGMSLALAHAFRLADLLAAQPAVDVAQRRAVARMTEEMFLPWYTQSAASDRARIARWRSAADGTPLPSKTPSGTGRPTTEDIAAAAHRDGTVWRGLMRMLMTLATPAEAFADDAFLARVRQAAPASLNRPRQPDRDELVHHVLEAEGAPL
ncbi:hypothetical protein AB0D42_39115 [Streptomyces sp. NPDC048304]|uniref:hypothetical protein n=1 Tax=Streptomyces sp. NPDC048304 TaxID=3154820 RepID=UPI00340D7400